MCAKLGRPVGSIKETHKCNRCKLPKARGEFYRAGPTIANVCKSCNTEDVLIRSYKRLAKSNPDKLRTMMYENAHRTVLMLQALEYEKGH